MPTFQFSRLVHQIQSEKQVHFFVGDDFEDFVSIIDTWIKHLVLRK